MAITTIELCYPTHRGTLSLRGSPPLSWTESLSPVRVRGSSHLFEVDVPVDTLLEIKAMRDDGLWSSGRNFTVQGGETLELHPYFERSQGSLESDWQTLLAPSLDRGFRFRVFLPPSYDEHEEKRYPVLYAQDGQSLFSDSPDPIDGRSWRMDDALDELWSLGAMEEAIVVALRTDVERLDILSPVPDPKHGGGQGERYRTFLTDTLKPAVDARYRTLPGRTTTALIGSSMGGLFSFWAAWSRPDVFGKAACLSSSFWWADRWMVRAAEGRCPLPRPFLYLDSGAARSPFEEDANLRDGYHHTMALRQALVRHCYVAGEDLHALAFAGLSHDNASWAARLSIPLQLLFPRKG